MEKRSILRMTCLVIAVFCTLLSFSGCVDMPVVSELPDKSAETESAGVYETEPGTDFSATANIPVDKNIVRVTVRQMPSRLSEDQYMRVYKTTEKINAVIEYISSLELSSDLGENPDEYCGCSYSITLTDREGGVYDYIHFGNMFWRESSGDWQRMKYKQAVEFESILYKYESDIRYDLTDDEECIYTEAGKSRELLRSQHAVRSSFPWYLRGMTQEADSM